MKPEQQINVDGYLHNIQQKNYYKNMREHDAQIESPDEYSDFEIDLYNMGISLISRNNRNRCIWPCLHRLLSQQL